MAEKFSWENCLNRTEINMKFIPGFPNLVSNRFRSSMMKSRGVPPSLYCPVYTYLHVGTPRKLEQTRRLKGYVQYEARKESGDCNFSPYIRYFQHAHFMSIAGVGKRGA